jgi:hypothetical protein
MNKLFAVLSIALLLFGTSGVAQEDAGLYEEYEAYEYRTYGDVGVGDYEEFGEYNEEEVGFPYGNMVVTATGPEGNAIDLILTGPDGYTRVAEANVEEETFIEELPLGIYSVAATDDEVEVGHAFVAVRAGQAVPLNLTLRPYNLDEAGVGDGSGFEEGYVGYGMEEEFGGGYEPYGEFEAGEYGTYENEQAGSIVVMVEGYNEEGELLGYEELGVEVTGFIVGPDDQREEVAGETRTEELAPGTYSVAVTAPGYQVTQTLVRVFPGRIATLTARIEPLSVAAVGAEADVQEVEVTGTDPTVTGVNLFTTWDADADSIITTEEYNRGLFGILSGDDEVIEEAEWDESYGYAFTELDQDQDGQLTEDEFIAGYESDLYTQWDVDGNQELTEDEFNRGLFNTIDADANGAITEVEYGPYESWFGRSFSEFDTDADAQVTEEEYFGGF